MQICEQVFETDLLAEIHHLNTFVSDVRAATDLIISVFGFKVTSPVLNFSPAIQIKLTAQK